MERKLKVAIIGGGGIFGAHAPGYTRLADLCEVVAVADPNEACHTRIRRHLGDSVPIYKDYDEVLALPGLDAVDILLPHNLHMDAAVKAAGKGLHVLCEKVMARNVYECRAMIDACDKAGVLLVICHDRRYAGDWVALKNIVDSGELGEILFIKMEHNQDVCPPEGSWIRTFDGIGGGAVMSCLCHQIDAMRWYFGEVDKVNCMSRVLPSRMEGECIGVINATMKSGALAQININWYTQAYSFMRPVENGLPYESIHVTGTRGDAYFIHGKGTFFKKNSHLFPNVKDEFVRVDTEQTISGHQKCVEEFVKAARGESANILTYGKDAIKTVEIAEAAYLSADNNTVVTLPVTPVAWDQRYPGRT